MKELIEKAKELFGKGTIDALLGWKYNERIKDVAPALFKKGDDLDHLVFDNRSVHNLTTYLTTVSDRYKKVGIIVKGCDGRSLVTQIIEHRIDRSKVYVIAVACDGVIIDGKEAQKCADCATHVSPLADVVIGTPKPAEQPSFEEIKKIEAMSPQERWEFFSKQFEKCTRCYACRQICPLCYCELCLLDQQEPKWIEQSAKLSSNTMWHLVRAYHLAGRCSDCGECDRVCPEKIPLRLLNNAMEKSVMEMFDVRPGTDPEQLPPLVTLSKSDPDAIMGGTV